VIVHAGSEAGFVPNALAMFKSGSKSGDYHDDMNFENYQKWLRTQLIPNLPARSVLLVDNASYHNKQYDSAPNANTKKADMQAWLTNKGIPFTASMYKPQLYDIIKLNKDRFRKFNIDKLLSENNHDVLRLPPYHPDLNPIEMAWAAIKGHVSSKNVEWNVTRVMELVREKADAMGSGNGKSCVIR
jgi:transposase